MAFSVFNQDDNRALGNIIEGFGLFTGMNNSALGIVFMHVALAQKPANGGIGLSFINRVHKDKVLILTLNVSLLYI